MKKYDNIEQGSDEWFQIRKGKITGTTLKSIMGTPRARQEAIYEIIAERLTVGIENETSYENPMERGKRLEPEAIAMFEFVTGKKVSKTGFCEDDENSSIANSPDGLIEEEDGALEIKCFGGKNYVKMWLTNEIPDEYQAQKIQYFVLNENLKTLYFAGYNPDIPVHPMHIIEVHRADVLDEIEKAREAQVAFLVEVNTILKTIIKL